MTASAHLDLVSLIVPGVSNFDATRERMREAGIVFEGEPRAETYGQVIVFRDPFGNRWDLLSPYTL